MDTQKSKCFAVTTHSIAKECAFLDRSLAINFSELFLKHLIITILTTQIERNKKFIAFFPKRFEFVGLISALVEAVPYHCYQMHCISVELTDWIKGLQ